VPEHPKALTEHDCLRFSLFKDDEIELSRGKEKTRVALAGRLRADDFETLKSLALRDASIAYLPSFLCAEEAKQRRLERVLPDWRGAAVTFSFVYPAQRFVSPKVRAFISAAEEVWQRQKF